MSEYALFKNILKEMKLLRMDYINQTATFNKEIGIIKKYIARTGKRLDEFKDVLNIIVNKRPDQTIIGKLNEILRILNTK